MSIYLIGKCDLCDKEIKVSEKIRMTNKVNGNVLDICEECYVREFKSSTN